MPSTIEKRPSSVATVFFDLLNPVAFGLFVGALIFDAVYADSTDILRMKSAAWLIAAGDRAVAPHARPVPDLIHTVEPLPNVGVRATRTPVGGQPAFR